MEFLLQFGASINKFSMHFPMGFKISITLLLHHLFFRLKMLYDILDQPVKGRSNCRSLFPRYRIIECIYATEQLLVLLITSSNSCTITFHCPFH